MCLQQFPKNTNVRFSTDVFGLWVPCSGTGMRESTLSKRIIAAVMRSESTTLTSDVDPGMIGWH